MSTEFLDTRLVQAVGWALLHLLWQATLVAVVLAIALAMLRRQAAAVRYVVACGALVVVMVLPALTLWNGFFLAPREEARGARSKTRLGDAASEQSSRGTPTGSFPLLELQALSAPETGYGSASPLSSYDTFVNQLEYYLPLLVTLWVVGVLWSSSRVMLAWMRLRRLALRGALASPEWQHALARLTRRIRLSRPVRLLESAVVEVPTVIGWLRPVVLLPLSALTGMTRQQLETILAHELAHIRRNDFIVNLFQTAVETLFFYHPAVWWISSRIRVEREHCCDDLAVELCGNPLLYARALAELERTRFTSPTPALALSGGSLLQRVKRLISDSPRRCSAQWLAGVSILTLVAGLAIAAPLSLLAIRDDQQPAKKDKSQAASKAPTPAPEPAAETITVVAPSEATTDDEDFDEWLADAEEVEAMEAMDHEAIAAEVAHEVAAAAPLIAVTAADAVGRLPLLRGQLGTLLGQHLVGGLAYAFAAPQAVQGTQVVVTPKVVKVPRAVVQVNGDDFDFDFDFDFDYDFDFDFEWNDETPEAVTAQAKAEAKKPLNRASLTVDDLIKLKSLGITPAYIEELDRAGYRNLTLNEIAALRNAGVTTEVIRQFGSMGLTNLSARDLARLRNAGVTAEYLRDLRAAGYTDLSASDVAKLRNAGVTTEFIAFAKSIGFSLTVKDLVRLKNIGVDREFVEGLSKNGFTGLTTEELVKWKAVGVTPEFAREMKNTFEKISTEDLIRLRAAGVTSDFVRSLREAGLTNLTASQVIRLRNAGVDAEFIKQMKKQGN